MKQTEVENAKPATAGPPGAAEPLVPLEAGTVTAEQLEGLKERAAKADEHWERLLRTTADFDNYKKRAARERQEAARYANQELLHKLIVVVDNLDAALAAAQSAPDKAAQSLQTGVNMIHQQLRKALADAGLEEVNALGQKFDPALHEAVAQKETTDAPEGQVIEQLRKGYRLRERLLRPATVVVAKQPAA